MRAKCKLSVTELSELLPYNAEKRRQRVKLVAQYDLTVPEDQKFQEATPHGEMEMHIDNQALIDGFKLGDQFYVTLEKIEA